jgi:uncharacterized protein YeaO (DUF488 family)
MVKIIRVYKFPDRKDNFRIMVNDLCSEGLCKEKNKLDLWLKDTANICKEEFENKIRLIDEIWEKKKENLALTWI